MNQNKKYDQGRSLNCCYDSLREFGIHSEQSFLNTNFLVLIKIKYSDYTTAQLL